MNDDQIRPFIEEHFNDWDEIKTILMMVKSYQIVQKEVAELNLNATEIEHRQIMIALMKSIITNKDTRLEIVESMSNFVKCDYTKCHKMIKIEMNSQQMIEK
jgi:hypothetical protein